MKFTIISHNGKIQPVADAVISIETVAGMYGFGVYETIKVRKGQIYFLPQHIQRLFYSAKAIDLIHPYTQSDVMEYVKNLVLTLESVDCNIKITLYGGSTPDQFQLFIIPSAPLFPQRSWYRDGVSLMSAVYERWMPQAKTLNMLASYYLYTKAKKNSCYDALLLDTKGNIREGTRTNVYVMKGKKIFSPPKEDVLEGVTMMTLEKVIKKTDYTVEYKEIPFADVFDFDGMFITSTSTKILPIKQIDDNSYPSIAPAIIDLIKTYETALDLSEGDFERL